MGLSMVVGTTFFLVVALRYLITHAFASFLHPAIVRHALSVAVTTSLLLQCLDAIFIYPRFRSPFRHLPTIRYNDLLEIKIVTEQPRGNTPLEWIKANPNVDVLHSRSAFESRLFPVSPAALRDVLSTNAYDYVKPWGFRAFLARLIGFGLILAEGTEHKRQRKALTPAFNIRNIRALYGLMWEKTGVFLSQLAKEVEANGYVEMLAWSSHLGLDIIGEAALSYDFQSLTKGEHYIVKAFATVGEPTDAMQIFMALNTLLELPQWLLAGLPISINKMIRKESSSLRLYCSKILAEKRDSYSHDEVAAEYDILGNIIQSNEFADEQIIDQMLTIIAAGHATTASSLTWCCMFLAQDINIQVRLRNEIRKSVPSPDSGEAVTAALLEGLPYLNGVCEEVLRLFPTVPATIRKTARATTLLNTHIPKGTDIRILPYAINRNPHYWGSDAAEMVPERWIDTDTNGVQRPNKNGGASSNYANVTFLHGSRACIGRDFAKAELRCAVAGLAGRFHIELLDPSHPIKVGGIVTTEPLDGLKVKLRILEGW